MIAIRLKQAGTKNRKRWRIVVADSRVPRNGRLLEELGSCNPMVDPPKLNIQMDRYEAWIKKGAKPTDTVRTLIRKVKKAS